MTTNIITQEVQLENRRGQSSYFDGGLLQFIGWCILGTLVTVFTLGICYPWSITMIYGWKINHTVVEGRRLKFNGSAIGLFGHWIKWWILTVITIGIYGFWVFIKLEDWKARNTSFAK
ncbi:hypothetical protein ACQKNX_12200 [Lysinibacillus sp. NPDC093712]|uniref:hypothetical protein n=1 Tax=Lysinibacillus sp. NPDC093712 TaxID=3390579 RepID=UPI003CFDEEEA